ncbi:MFS transporter [Algibacter sp. L1A34]|uniref:MFS transporter n=1 Tax=Algibacter sp. L1A34 TaxID=2686365 RepID=UPI00131DA3CF|nr:MFS transporter [Algibacter sp. L1A34]
MKQTKYILPIIVFAQFCCTSLWFATNGVIEDLVNNFTLNQSALGHLSSAVQFGFIIGTFLFALLTITDRFSPSKVFFVSAVLAAIFNLMIVLEDHNLSSLLILRFGTGFFLAGIYPVGMKIAADYFDKGLGKSLGYLVGALVLGTAFPHVLKGFGSSFSWQHIIYTTTVLAMLGGIVMLVFVPDGPFRKPVTKFDISVLFNVFKVHDFRKAAFGYFGHMWELYTFWAFVPIILKAYVELHPEVEFNIPMLSFVIIASGSLACVVSGYLSQVYGAKKIGAMALLFSGLCCLVSPLFFSLNSEVVFVIFLVFWGMVVVADSPLFSTLVAQNVNAEHKGTALTIVNSIGFAITIVSIQLASNLIDVMEVKYLFLIIAIGPILGLLGLLNKN